MGYSLIVWNPILHMVVRTRPDAVQPHARNAEDSRSYSEIKDHVRINSSVAEILGSADRDTSAFLHLHSMWPSTRYVQMVQDAMTSHFLDPRGQSQHPRKTMIKAC